MDNKLIIAKKRKRFDTIRSTHTLLSQCPRLPFDDECFKFVSHGDFSCASFIALVAKYTVINTLYASTFSMGKKECLLFDNLADDGRLNDVHIVVSSQIFNGNNHSTTRTIKGFCDKFDWKIVAKKNHSKILLFDTDDGQFVLETSSNLNANSKTEFYSFEKDLLLYQFYLKEIFDTGDGIDFVKYGVGDG